MIEDLTRRQFIQRTAGVALAAWLLSKPGKVADALAALDSAPAFSVPVGYVVAYAGDVPPPGWILCDGSTVDVAEYPALFRVIGNAYGGSRWSRRFRLPDLRGRAVSGIVDRGVGSPPPDPYAIQAVIKAA